MRGRDFLAVARADARESTEAHWRTAANRAYFALMLEVRDTFTRWGLSPPPQSAVHTITRRRSFTSSDNDVKSIGTTFDRLQGLRRRADYEMTTNLEFATNRKALSSVQNAEIALALLYALDADVPRRTAVFAEIHKVLP